MTELQGWIVIVLLMLILYSLWRIAKWDEALRRAEQQRSKRDR